MGVVCGELFAPSPFPFTPVESDKSQLCYRAHSERSHLRNSKLCMPNSVRESKNFQSKIVANLDPIFPREIVRKSRETNALTTAATKTFTDTQEFIVAYLDFASANARTRFPNAKGH